MALIPFAVAPLNRPRPTDGFSYEGLLGGRTVLEHLDDIRKRLVYSAIAMGVGVAIGFAFVNRVFDFLMRPTRAVLPPGTELVYTDPGEAFSLYIEIALILGLVAAMPFILLQVWTLLAPLMPRRSKLMAFAFVTFTTLGFVSGAAFTHYVAFPYMMAFFASFNAPDLVFMPQLNDVFDLYLKMLVGMGAVFQMPTAVFFLSKVGMVSAGLLWKSFRYALLLIFIAAAVITPTGDMVTQAIFAAPMIGLYLLSIVVAWIFGRPRIEESESDTVD
jgi:sec-independent protein translocase protein TatC